MSGSSGKSNELESRISSKTEAGRKNLVADNSGQNYTVPKKNEPRKLSSSVRIESEKLSNYRDRKAKGENSGTRDYAKNLETIRNKLKLLDITQRSSSTSLKNDAQPQCSSFSPRTAGLHISAPSSTKTTFSNNKKKIEAQVTFSNSLSSSNSSPKNDKSTIEHKQVSGGSSSRSAKIINICSPRKMYFTSSSISNSSSNGGFYSHRPMAYKKSKKILQHLKKRATSSGSASGSSKKSLSNELVKPKKLTRKTVKNKGPSIVDVLNKVCNPQWELPGKQSNRTVSDDASISTSTTDEDEAIVTLVTDCQKFVKEARETLQSTSKTQNVESPGSRQSSPQKYNTVAYNKPKDRPITRRNEQCSPFKGASKGLATNPTKCETRSQSPKMSQSALSKNVSPKTRSQLRSPRNVKKYTRTETKIYRKSNSSSNSVLPKHRDTKTEGDVSSKSASFRKIKKSDDRIQSKHVKPKILEKTEALTLTSMICSPKEELSSAETKKAEHPFQLTPTPPKTEQQSEKSVPYKFPFPSSTIPKAFTLESLSCDDANNIKDKKKPATSPYNPSSNITDLRVYSIHLDLPNAFNSVDSWRSSCLIPYLKKKHRKLNHVGARSGSSFNNRRGFSGTKSLQLTISPKKLILTRRSKSLPEKGKRLSGGHSQRKVETMFLNPAYTDLSTSRSETCCSEALSCPIPSKRICMREDPDYDVFQIIIENDDNCSIASTCTSPPKKMCVRDKTPEITEDFKKDYYSGTPSEKDSLESVPSDDFKNSILSMLLEWREKEIDKTNKNKSTTSWVNETTNSELYQTETITQEPEVKEVITICEKYKTDPFPSPEAQEDNYFSVDFDEERFGRQLAAISEETRIVSEEDVNLKSIYSTGCISTDEELTIKIPLEPEVTVVDSLQTSSSRKSCEEVNNKQDATTSVQNLTMENKETSACQESFLIDVGQQYELKEAELCDVGVTTSKTLDKKVETHDKSSWVCSCFLMPLLKRSVFEAYKVPYGEGDPIISLVELKEDPAVAINQNLEKKKSNDQSKMTTASDKDLSNRDDNTMISFNPGLMVSLDVPRKFLCLYDFPTITKITTISGNCESCVSVWEKKVNVLTEGSVKSRLSSPKSRLTSGSRKPKDVSWEDNLMPEKKLPKLTDEIDRNLFTVLYRSRSCAAYTPEKSTSSVCRCQSERGLSELSESDDEDEKQSGCFNCFRRLFGGRTKRFFDSHSY